MKNIYNLINKYGKESILIFCNNYKITYEELVEFFLKKEKENLFEFNKLYDSINEILKVIKKFLDESMPIYDIKTEFNEAINYYIGMAKKRFILQQALDFCEKEFLNAVQTP